MMIIKKIDALSLAKIQGLLGVLVGLIAGIVMGITSTLMNSMLKASIAGAEESVAVTPMFNGLGWLAVIVLPILYGIFFFIAGLIGAGLYNMAARMVGGMKMELEYEKAETPTQPVQPPQQQIRR